MKKPSNKMFNLDKRTVTLYFDDGSHDEFYIRGGISWPEVTLVSGIKDIQGFAILAGLDIHKKKLHIFEEKEFLVIDHILNPDNTIRYEGLAPWFGYVWSRYFGKDFFWHGDYEDHKRNHLEILRSPMIMPKPTFIQVHWADHHEGSMSIWRAIKTETIVADIKTELYRQLSMVKTDAKQSLPAVKALQGLLAGLERYPYKQRTV